MASPTLASRRTFLFCVALQNREADDIVWNGLSVILRFPFNFYHVYEELLQVCHIFVSFHYKCFSRVFYFTRRFQNHSGLRRGNDAFCDYFVVCLTGRRGRRSCDDVEISL